MALNLIGVIRVQSAEEDIRSDLERRALPGRMFKLRSFMTCTGDQNYSDYKIIKKNDILRA